MKTRVITRFVAPALLAWLSTLSLPLSTAHAAPGDLDRTFAGTGESLVGFGGGVQNCYAATVQADGKLVLAGRGITAGGLSEFELVRFGTNNVLDPTFGAGGAVFTAFSPPSDNPSYNDFGSIAEAVAIQADGKIVAAGGADASGFPPLNIVMARYNPDGSLDTTFGTGGKVITKLPNKQSSAYAMAIQYDGKIVVAGEAYGDVLLARYNTNGVLDTSFGSGGAVITATGGGAPGSDGASALLIQPNGDYVVTGSGGGGSEFAVVRYTTNGVLDTTFGGTGMVLTPIHSLTNSYTNSFATSIGYQSGNNTIQNPDKLVVVGTSVNYESSEVFSVVRYNLDGTLDTNFNATGILTGTFGSDAVLDFGRAVLVQRGGSLIHPREIITVAGVDVAESGAYLGMARFNADGSLDTTFGTNGTGKVRIPFDQTGNATIYTPMALTIQAGQIVLAYNPEREDEPVSFPLGREVFGAARSTSSGALDTTFGTNGYVTADVCGTATPAGLAIQADGKLVVAGYKFEDRQSFALARYNPDGSLDSSFGSNGKVLSPIGPTNSAALAVGIQPDGKIVATGPNSTGLYADFAVVRFQTNGLLDPLFGNAGQVFTSISGFNDIPSSLAFQSDGKIVVAGSSGLAIDEFALVRYMTNGALDTTFGGTGKVTTSIAGGESVASAVQIQADGKIVALGYAQVNSHTNFAVARYNLDGSLDDSFGSSGKVTTEIDGGRSLATGVQIQADGKIVAAGLAQIGGTNYIALARYLTNGTLDASFGTGGTVTTQVTTNDSANAVAVLPDGKIAVAGSSHQDVFSQDVIVRYNPNGSLDGSFGTGGKVLVDFADGSDHANALAVDQIGRLVATGYANGLFGTARLESEPALKTTSLTRLINGQVTLQGLGVPNASITLEVSGSVGPGSFSPLDSVTPDAGGFWQYQDTNAAGLNSRFYRLSHP